jgi:hypothetical protein
MAGFEEARRLEAALEGMIPHRQFTTGCVLGSLLAIFKPTILANTITSVWRKNDEKIE